MSVDSFFFFFSYKIRKITKRITSTGKTVIYLIKGRGITIEEEVHV